jgi:hypothetical protein
MTGQYHHWRPATRGAASALWGARRAARGSFSEPTQNLDDGGTH